MNVPVCPEHGSTAIVTVEHPDIYDGGLYWSCEGCRRHWHRFSPTDGIDRTHPRMRAARYFARMGITPEAT